MKFEINDWVCSGIVLLILVDKHEEDCRCDYDRDDDAGKNKSPSEHAPAAIGTSPGRTAHPIPTIRAELLPSFVTHF
jgi:hypothetical protein